MNISQLQESELLAVVRQELLVDPNVDNYLQQATSLTIDDYGATLPVFAHKTATFFSWPEYWGKLKREFKRFVCDSTSEYAPLRQKFEGLGVDAHKFVLATLSAALAPKIGLAAGVLVPFCALCLVALSRMGKEALCSMDDWKMPLEIDGGR